MAEDTKVKNDGRFKKGEKRSTSWKPGQSGNPAGRPKTPDFFKDNGVKASPTLIRAMIMKFGQMTKEEMMTFLATPFPTMLESMICSIMLKAVVEGDHSRVNFLLDRLIGKVSEKIDVQVGPKIVFKTTLSEGGALIQDLVKESLPSPAEEDFVN
jgi:hypothetical protein